MGGIGYELARHGSSLWGLDQEVEQEARRAFHQRIGAFLKEFLVAGEEVMLPRVLAKPGRPHGPDAPDAVGRRGESPHIREMVHDPSAGAVVNLRRAAAGLDERLHVIEERQMALAQIGDLRGPVVHL